MQRHLARTAGRWKDSPRKNAMSELQDELMSVRLREAEAQAELKETRQRMLELDTQVLTHVPHTLTFMITFMTCRAIMRRPISNPIFTSLLIFFKDSYFVQDLLSHTFFLATSTCFVIFRMGNQILPK